MIDYPAPFSWLNLDELNKKPQKFPSEAVASKFPLFFQLTAAALVMLLDKNAATYSSAQNLIFGSPTSSDRKSSSSLDQFDINKPTTIYSILNSAEKLQEAIAIIKRRITAENPLCQIDAITADDEYKLTLAYQVYRRDAPTTLMDMDCSLTYITVDHLRKDKDQLCPKLPFGLLHEHLSAVTVIERLSVLVASLSRGDVECAQEQYKKCLNILQSYAVTSYGLQGVELEKLNHTELIKIIIKLDLNQVALNGAPSSPQWFSEQDASLHFINWMHRSFLVYQELYSRLKGNESSREKSREDRAHIKRLALPLLKSKLPDTKEKWKSPTEAYKKVFHSLITELEKSPIVSAKKSEKKSISDKTFKAVLAEMAAENPELFDKK